MFSGEKRASVLISKENLLPFISVKDLSGFIHTLLDQLQHSSFEHLMFASTHTDRRMSVKKNCS